MFIIPTKPDTAGAQQELNRWVSDAEKNSVITLKVDADNKQLMAKVSAGLGKAQLYAEGLNKALDFGQGVAGKFGAIDESTNKTVDHLQSAATTTLSWAATGAQLGSVFPGIGTAVGAVVGGLAGAASETYSWYQESKKVEDSTGKISEFYLTAKGYLFDLIEQGKEWVENAIAVEAAWARAGEVLAGDKPQKSARELKAAWEDAAQGLRDMNEAGVFTAEQIDAQTEKVKEAKEAYKEAAASVNSYTQATKELSEATKTAIVDLNSVEFILGGLETDKNVGDSALGAMQRDAIDTQAKIQAFFDANPITVPLVFPKGPIPELPKFTEEVEDFKEAARDLAASVTNTLGGAAVKGINAFYDAWANGAERTKEDRKRARAEFERDLGTTLMTDGAGHIAMGTAKLFSSVTRSQGLGEIAAGGAEVALGAGLGGVGALTQRRLGGTEAPSSSTPSTAPGNGLGGGSQGTQDLRPIVVQFHSTVPMTEREQQEAGSRLLDFIDKARRR